MADLDTALASNLAAARDFIAAADKLGDVWMTPRAPGKWSAAQLAEHIALTYDQVLPDHAGRSDRHAVHSTPVTT